MKTLVLTLVCVVSMVCRAESFEEKVLAMIDGLKEAVIDLDERSNDTGRGRINDLQRTMDEVFEVMGVAQNHAGYYLEQINDLDAADTDFAGIRNDILKAEVRLAHAESRVSQYRTWYDRLLSKVYRIRDIWYFVLKGDNFASWDWIKENYIVENFVVSENTYTLDPILQMATRTLGGYRFTMDYGSGLPSPNIEYGERVCDAQCSCRQEYEFEGLEDAQALRDNFDALASSWEQYNKANDIPD